MVTPWLDPLHPIPHPYSLHRSFICSLHTADNETWAGRITPTQALQQYREAMDIPARLIVMAFSATDFTIADPADAGMLDVAGLDSGVPAIVAEFVTGQV